MTDKDLAKRLFLRNVNLEAFPALVKLLKSDDKDKDHAVTEEEIEEVRAALATTTMMNDFMVEYCKELERAYRTDVPLKVK